MLLLSACRASFNRDLHQELNAFTARGGGEGVLVGGKGVLLVCVCRGTKWIHHALDVVEFQAAA